MKKEVTEMFESRELGLGDDHVSVGYRSMRTSAQTLRAC